MCVKIVQNTQSLRHSALQSTDALVLNAQCSCRGVPVMSVVCAKQCLWYAEITIGCDVLRQQTETTLEENKNKFHCWWYSVPWHFVWGILSWTRPSNRITGFVRRSVRSSFCAVVLRRFQRWWMKLKTNCFTRSSMTLVMYCSNRCQTNAVN